MLAIEASGVTIRYNEGSDHEILAVNNVDVAVAPGHIVTLIGPSGCGKSTLLHSIGGLLHPSSGTIKVGGELMNRPDPNRAAFVFQEYSLLPWKNIIDNVALGLRFAGVSKHERDTIALKQLDILGLSEFARARPKQLSGGMQQRVSVARALVMQPRLLLMDEPFGALDEQTRLRVGEDIARVLHMEDRSALFVTHSLDEAIFMADEVVVLSARPAQIRDIISVEEPKPRNRSFMGTSRFAELRARLFNGLEVPAEPDLPYEGSQIS